MALSSARLEIQWSPIHQNKFITWGNEISLFEVESFKNEINKSYVKLSDLTGAQLLATNSNHHYVKCIDIYPKANSDLFLAVGQANGRVMLTSFGPSEFDGIGLTGKELVPRHARQCNAVAWNPLEPNILAAGLDRIRADHSILLWDINKCSLPGDGNGSNRLIGNSNNSHHNAQAAVELPKPVAEFGISETANSLAWFRGQPRVLAVGLNQKSIKVIDFRDANKVIYSAQNKSVFGLCVHPHNDRHLASFAENFINIWDTRNFEKPILTLVQNKPVLKIHWSPTRHNLLGSLQRDSSVIHLHDIQHTFIGNEEVEPTVLERSVIPGSPHNITSFSWHAFDENRLLTIALSGNITDYVVFERITLNWAPTSSMVWSHGRKLLKYVNNVNEDVAVDYDISSKIKQRCLVGYGLKSEFWQNGELSGDEMLSDVWQWLYLSRNLVEEGDLRGSNIKHPGVKTILKIENTYNPSIGIKSDIIQTPWMELGNKNCYGAARVYRSEDREKALHLCNWRFEKDTTLLANYIDSLEKHGQFSRAAAIAVFNLKIYSAIEILKRGAERTDDNNLNAVAMALAGFTDDKNSMWRKMCASTKSQLSDPYLRAMFSFLTADNYTYDHVLNENGISVEDRIAFACMFLSDKKLSDYLNILTAKLIEEGNLYGLILTGTVREGLSLLQKYLDLTGDIQTTTLIAVKAFPPNLQQDMCVQEWIASYRNLLDSWLLWDQRAHFDIMLSSCNSADKPPQQVYVSCNFCGKSISAYMQGLNRGRGSFSRLGGTSNKLKMSSCPNCRKPLPRCAICLMHMGTASGNPISVNSEGEQKMVEFSSWFTWCQSCRHGGHAIHMMNWFKEHSECPVTPCSCRCFSVDACGSNISFDGQKVNSATEKSKPVQPW